MVAISGLHIPFAPEVTRLQTEAQRVAQARGVVSVEPVDLLLALLRNERGEVRTVLHTLNVDADLVIAQLPQASEGSAAAPPSLSRASQEVLLAAHSEAQRLQHPQVDALHLLIGLLYDSQDPAARALDRAGLQLYDVRKYLLAKPKQWKPLASATGGNWAKLRAAIQISPVFWAALGLFVASGVGLWFDPWPQYTRPMTMLFVIFGWIVSLCLHEFGHAVAAFLGGDTSAASNGYLTLNPLRYANPIFSFVLPVIFLMVGGIGLPGGAVMVNLHALRSRTWERYVAAAGPLATFLFALLCVLPFWLPGDIWLNGSLTFWGGLAMLGFLQFSALCFNLLPVPPLDGFGILAPMMSAETAWRWRMMGNYTMLILFMVMWNSNPISSAFWNGVFELSSWAGIPEMLLFVGMDNFRG